MISNNPYLILNIDKEASYDDIKRAYKKIALSCHPDKLYNITDEYIIKEKTELFKRATTAYNFLISKDDNKDFNNDFNINESEEWYNFFKNVFGNIYDSYKKNSLNHNIKLNVSYMQVYTNFKRKIRLFLKGIKDPLFFDIECGKYPYITKNYIDDNEEEHNINIELILTNDNSLYNHIINDDKTVDIITNITIELYEYLTGCIRTFNYIDNKELIITIPSFILKHIEYKKGINDGNFIINIEIKKIDKYNWNLLSDNKKDIIISNLKELL